MGAREAKLIIGSWPMQSFQIIGANGLDITDELPIKRVVVTAEAGDATVVELQVYAEVEVESGEIVLRPLRNPASAGAVDGV